MLFLCPCMPLSLSQQTSTFWPKEPEVGNPDFFANHLSSCEMCSALPGCAYGFKGVVKAPKHLHIHKKNKWLWIIYSRFGANENHNRCTTAWFCAWEPQTDPLLTPWVIPSMCLPLLLAWGSTWGSNQLAQGVTRMEHIPVVAWRFAVISSRVSRAWRRDQVLHSESPTGLKMDTSAEGGPVYDYLCKEEQEENPTK